MTNDSSDDEEVADQNSLDKDGGAAQQLMKNPIADGNGSALAQTETQMEKSKKQLNEEESATMEGSYPLDIVVRNIKDVVTNKQTDSSDEEDETTTKEINFVLQMHGFKVIEKENGADCEIITYEPSTSTASRLGNKMEEEGIFIAEEDEEKKEKPEGVVKGNSGVVGKTRFTKTHRRAYSMPNAHRERALLVVADDQVRQEGPRKRHVVRYRLHPYKPTPKTNEAINSFIESTNFSEFAMLTDDGTMDEFEVNIDEEEIMCFPANSKNPRTFARKFWEAKWKCQNFEFLPEWLQDNEFLRTGHRPPLASFTSCFKSIFSLHTETGNIWTHMYGCVAFLGVAIWFLAQPSSVIGWRDKAVFACFFFGAIFCLGLSFAFHTVQCHSEGVGKLFSKLDYAGISLLIVGSFIPWIYYGFYCRTLGMVIYITMITVLGIAALIVSLWDKFSQPKYRVLRMAVFLAMGLSSIFPAFHLLFTDGWTSMIENSSFHWLLLMGALYIIGATVYATRFPERCFPGRCDYFCHSHQFFHIFVIVAAFVHFYGITEMAMKRLEKGPCSGQLMEIYGSDEYRNMLDEWFRPY